MRLSLAQLRCSPLDARRNAETTVAAITAAYGQGVDLVVLPELAATGYIVDGPQLRQLAEPADGTGPVVGAWRRAAARTGVAVIGGFAELDGDRLYNSVAVVDGDGKMVGVYRKLHLFAGERAVFSPGDHGLPVFRVAGAALGVLVCYDLRFPEAMRILALQGADIVAVPTAWVGGFDRHAVHTDGSIGQVDGARVQANLNQVFVACADQVGETHAHTFLGRSVVVDPYGKILTGPLSAHDEAVVTVDIDPAEAIRARDRGVGISPRENRRTDIYADLLGYSPVVTGARP